MKKEVFIIIFFLILCLTSYSYGNVEETAEDLIAQGKVYLEKGYYNSAEAYFKEAIRFDPQNINSYFYLGSFYLDRLRFEEASNVFKEVIKIDKDNLEALFALGWAHSNLGYYKKAEEYYRKVISLEPNYIKAHIRLARLYFHLGREDDLAKELEILEKLDKNQYEEVLKYINK